MTEISLALNYQSIVVITSSKLLENKKKLDLENKMIIRVKKIFRNNESLFLRLINDMFFSLYVFYKIILSAKPNDKIFAVTNPPVMLAFLHILKIIKKLNYTLLVHDVFPDNIFLNKSKNSKIFINFFQNLFNKFYCSPDLIIAIGHDMREYLSKSKNILKSKIKVIPNWFDPKIKESTKNEKSKLRITYGGNIGRMQGLLDFLKILAQVDGRNNYLLDFYGNGPEKSNLIKFKDKLKLNNLTFHESFKREEQSKIFNLTDIALVSLKKGMYGLGVPSKVYNAMASGLPILYIGDVGSEVDLYVKEYDIGWSFNWNNTDKLKVFIENISSIDYNLIKKKGQNSLMLAKNNFSKKNILKNYQSL